MYEQELEQARWSGKPIKRFHREAMLNRAPAGGARAGEAAVELKEGIESAARKGRMTPRQVLDGAVNRLGGLKTSKSPAVEREFVPKFMEYAGGDAWLDKGKAPTVKPKKDAPRAKKDVTRAKKTNGS